MHPKVRHWIAPAGLLIALTAAMPARPAHFAVTLVRDGTTWSATCETGCAWTAVSAHKPRLVGRSVVLDNTGIQLWGTPHDSTVTFAFRVTADGRTGWTARSLTGTAWKDLSVDCSQAPCRARITETGVQRLR